MASRDLSGLFSIGTYLPSIAVGARRLHDTDRSGCLQLLWLIPIPHENRSWHRLRADRRRALWTEHADREDSDRRHVALAIGGTAVLGIRYRPGAGLDDPSNGRGPGWYHSAARRRDAVVVGRHYSGRRGRSLLADVRPAGRRFGVGLFDSQSG